MSFPQFFQRNRLKGLYALHYQIFVRFFDHFRCIFFIRWLVPPFLSLLNQYYCNIIFPHFHNYISKPNEKYSKFVHIFWTMQYLKFGGTT